MVSIILKMENIGKWKFIKLCRKNHLMKRKTETIIFYISRLLNDFEINYLSLNLVFILLKEFGSESAARNCIQGIHK